MINKQKGPQLECLRASKGRHSWRIDEGVFSKKQAKQQLSGNFLSYNCQAYSPLQPPRADWRERWQIAAQLSNRMQYSPYSEKIAHLIHRLTAPVSVFRRA